MTWWTQLYLALYLIFAIAGIWDDYRSNRKMCFLIVAGVSNAIVAYLFVSYWQPSRLDGIGFVAPTAFVASMCWELFQAIQDAKADEGDSEDRGRAIAGIATASVISLPAFIVAGISAFRT